MDSNVAGKLISMMMVSSSSSSSGKGDSDAAAEEKKRRFSEAQVRSLEMIFESQAKLEPRKKQQLAKELGLQPRQVAIWFQNKRARWKSKQLERAYAALRADYDDLRSSFDSLLLQKNALSSQVQRLGEMLGSNCTQENSKEEEHSEQRNCSEGDKASAMSLSSNVNNSDEEEKKANATLGREDSEKHQQQSCFNVGWPSDPMIAGGGVCSQWWEFLSYE